MAAPLIVSLPAIFSALWAGLVVCFKWLVDHAHITKVAIVCILIIASFRLGTTVYNTVLVDIQQYVVDLNNNVPHVLSTSLDLLAKANYCLPVSEMLALLSVYVTCWGICMLIRFIISVYRNIPFKNA